MPVYEFQCKQCNQIFEYQQRLADEPKSICEACGGALEKLISRSAFQFKGGGWYKDLYASTKPAATGGGADTTAPAKTETAPSGASTSPAPTAPATTPSGGGSTGGNGAQASQR
ncbi:MAG: zinc ribbon domain-containing protein [Myxococcales bacterium]|nr:zinc ribbon domain-containing protein [Myxococcales bacterium]